MCDQISFTVGKATGVAWYREDWGRAKLETGSQKVLVRITVACKRDWSTEKEYWET